MTERDQRAKQVTVVGALANLTLTALKFVFGIVTSSAALLADAIHSLSDLISDFVVYVAILFGSREADENHQYGHRRFETIGSISVGFVIIATGLGLGYDLIQRLQDTTQWTHPGQAALYVAAFSILVKEVLYQYTHRMGVKYHHSLLKANAVHHRTDALSSIVVVVGLVANEFGITVGDLAAALVVAFMLTRVGMKIVYEGLLEISEAGVDEETYATLRSTILETEGVVDMHVLRTKLIAGEIFAETHAQVNPYLSVTQGHEIAHRIIERVNNAVPQMKELTVHIDPEDDMDEEIELPNCSKLEQHIREVWSQQCSLDELHYVTLHILMNGVQAWLRVGEGVDSTVLQHIHEALIQHPSIASIDFVSKRRL